MTPGATSAIVDPCCDLVGLSSSLITKDVLTSEGKRFMLKLRRASTTSWDHL
eukprot:CAMPEP_0117657262 /NCGR_PEP_ID=MMETSP0804-20121206/5237_1 /TAXON_ID=1074897 /ORGANISM="Tetraselmis astigmatica, Strain CCMP880" /LENGTH=51 /DNA_ID=CAMNT_0005463705 /DNA_START=1502 /DNA_END=1657 /DNA_ORIENTATION=-